MKPILVIHGYSSEGKDNPPQKIYGNFTDALRKEIGEDIVFELNLSRWISLDDGVSLDDVSFAMDRALKSNHASALKDGFHVVIHSTGALVVRNWIRLFSPKPSPVENLVHLAGANFGSGLAHIGKGQLSRWSRILFMGTGSGTKILSELEFGSWKTIDLQRHFLQPGHDMNRDYRVQEYCLIGSQTTSAMRAIPIRYVKEDCSDNTVRIPACNLNFNYVAVKPRPEAFTMTGATVKKRIEKRKENKTFESAEYEIDLSGLASARVEVPFATAFETSHFGEEIGIMSGTDNRSEIMPLAARALQTRLDGDAYDETREAFAEYCRKTYARVARLKSNLFDWNKQAQYDGHAQVIFRLRDQFGVGIKDFDITVRTPSNRRDRFKLEKMIEDHHVNKSNNGCIVFYFRTQDFDKKKKTWIDRLQTISTTNIEITAHEGDCTEIDFLPLNLRLSPSQIRSVMQSFCTTIIDVTLLRLPTPKVFAIGKG